MNERTQQEPLLAIRHLSFGYARRSLLSSSQPVASVLQDVSFDLFASKSLALVGPSGSGKSTLARCILALERPQAGSIFYRGIDLLTLSAKELKLVRREIHLIFQDSASALDPVFTVEKLLAEPLAIHDVAGSRKHRDACIREALERVELPTSFLQRRASELSGGQRQRVAIARALMLQPSLIVLDEALSSLDLSTQGQIANLLLDLQAQHGIAYLYITHDFALAKLLSDQVAVMRAGRLLSSASSSPVLTANLHGDAARLAHDSSSGETVGVPPHPRDD